MPHAAAEQQQPTIAGVHLRVNDGPLDPSSVRPSAPPTLRAARRAPRALRRRRLPLPQGPAPARRRPRRPRRLLHQPGADRCAQARHGARRRHLRRRGRVGRRLPGHRRGERQERAPGGSSSARSVLFTDAALRAHTEPWYAGGGSSEGRDGSDGSKDGAAGGRGTRGFARHPALYDFVARFSSWGEDTLAVRRSLLRNNTPGNRAIGVHYDQSFMRYGEPTSVTAWVPMGDVRLEGGGLIYLEGGASPSPPREDSTKQLTDDMRKEALGAQIEDDFAAKARAAGMSDEETRDAFNANMMSTGFLSDGPAAFGRQHGRRWLVAAYEAGDVVLHSPHMIHASTINDDPDNRIRLGTDLRFVNSARPWDTRWSNHYTFDDGL
ncbi:hypothetical protein ACCO45_009782 [Purpureocillium lilacinum]|uniref:Uncharacterized protein n=1 Tax=Purpureocillium lilacinum TaxID=33203 RepID=A0ACC4DNB7_PURLI